MGNAHKLILAVFFLFLVFFFLLPSSAFAATTPFRSASIVTTDGNPAYTNLSNCSVTDGLTCDRLLGPDYGNLYFRNFGSYSDFGIPQKSKITKVRIRVTGKSSNGVGIGLLAGGVFGEMCQWPSYLWTTFSSQNIFTQTFVTPVIDEWQFGAARSYCFQSSFFNTNNFMWRINYSSSVFSIWTANIDNFEIAFDYIPPVIPTPTPTPTPSITPLILIPGIGGSELKVTEDTYWLEKDNGHGGVFNHTYPKDEVVWLNEPEARAPGDDDYFDVLRMQVDGVTSEANIGLTNNLLARAYQNAIDFFTANGYELNKDFFVFPYDWRKDIVLTSSLLDEKIAAIKQQTGSAKVDIVAHSMGGLVARNYIADSTKAQNVRKLFTLGTPHLGSPKFLKGLRDGICLKYPVGDFCLSLAPSELKDVLQNMISGYELAPSQTYFTFYFGEDGNHPYPYKTEVGALNYNQIKGLLTNLNYNTSLFTPSEVFHSIDSTLSNTNGVDVTIVAGSGQPTLGQIIEEKTTSMLGKEEVKKNIKIINGDETVPLFSASLNDPDRNLSFLGNAKLFYTKQEHGSLVSPGAALNLVKNILEENNELPTGVSMQAYSLPLLWLLSVHSPVNIHVYDSAGNHTGPTSDGFETNIPGSTYETLGDAKFVFVPDNGNYAVKFQATDNGSFDFKIRKLEKGTVTQQTLYKDIPLTMVTTGETQFDTTSAVSPIVRLDEDGNGSVDENIAPSAVASGSAVFDETAPQTNAELSGALGNEAWYGSDVLVTLSATDEASGSGVAKIEYTLGNVQTIYTYSEPFIISKEGVNKLKFRAFDNVGNEENPQEKEIKIDKTIPEAKVYVDLNKQDIVIEGIDQNQTTVEIDDAVYKITDIAGNTLKLDVRERDKNKQDRFRIYSIQYNNEPVKILANNHFNVSYNGKKSRVNVREQNFEVKGEIKIRIQYNVKKNQSTIIVKEPKGERIKEVKNGLILLNLLTSKGELKTSY